MAKKEIDSKQVVPIVHAILVDKYQYSPYSHTMSVTIDDFSYIIEQIGKWKAVDVTLLYFHPDLGPVAINPKNPDHFSLVNTLRENELITVYVGAFDSEVDDKLRDTAIKTMVKLLEGKKAKTPDSLLKGSLSFKPIKKEAPQKQKRSTKKSTGAKKSSAASAKTGAPEETREQAPVERKEAEEEGAGGAKRMTPFYAVPVTNELFHNGNVEAWKKIIQSYKTKHPDLEVYIYYEGERIHDIASLFKWGKVKHGSSILFAVAGSEIKDVAKLQRYLRQGASPQFEAFLRAPQNKILSLF
jgi:hypothetical protein